MALGAVWLWIEAGEVAGDRTRKIVPYARRWWSGDVVTVCDAANEACPVFPGAQSRLHWSIRDPSRATGDEEERLAVFRVVRDEIRERIEKEFVLAG